MKSTIQLSITQLLFVFLFIIPIFVGCQNQPADYVDEFNFLVPGELVKVPHSPEFDEIIKYSYKNEMFIAVQDFLNRSPNKGTVDPKISLSVDVTFKSSQLMTNYEGYDLSEMKTEQIKGNTYMSKTFESKQPGFKVYFEFGAIYLKESKTIYEFLITGKQANEEVHRGIIRRFLEGVR